MSKDEKKEQKSKDPLTRAELVKALALEIAMSDKFAGELLRAGEDKQANEWTGAGRRLSFIQQGLLNGSWPPAMPAGLRVVEKVAPLKGSPAPPLKRGGKKRS